MNPIRTIYRAVVPGGVRGAVASRRVWATGLWRNPVARREALADLWALLRRPVRHVRTPHGVVYVDVRDRFVGRTIYVNRGYEESETQFLARRLAPGMSYLDLGANVGFLAAVAAARVGPSGRVVAVEPDPHNFRLLARGVRASGRRNVTLVNAAAGPAPGTARLFKSDHNLGDHRLYAGSGTAARAAVEVPVVQIDDVFAAGHLTSPDVIKIDVQGYEAHVIAGMPRLLGGDRPMAVLSEFWPHGMREAGSDPAAYLDAFRSRGFSCHRLTANGETVSVAWGEVFDHVPPFDPASPDSSWVNLVFERGGRPGAA